MTIKQYDAKGDFVKTLLQVVALDDIICLVFYSLCICVASNLENNSFKYWFNIKAYFSLIYYLCFLV
ncbi:MAG: hypothetical protein L6U99_08395 [Clostridium sp.]|nr:MAG: hypothetical protein L6U99_08395 [Clostridium sp.]